MTEQIENGFFKLLQSNIVIDIGERKYREGKFLNFRIKDFYIQLDVIVKGKNRCIDIPIPYKVYDLDNGLGFSYEFKDMGNYGEDVDRMLRNSIGGGKSKLYNTTLTIKRIENE
jgi:hypothetical protein